MLISPPFLPLPDANHNEAVWLNSAFDEPQLRPSTRAPAGSFPLGEDLNWHNGLHLQGRQGTDGHTVVHAIADGEVIFAEPPRRENDAPDDPQNYNPFGATASWTDNGLVIVRHTTEIGAAGDQLTTLTYYSAYMHLTHIATRATPQGGNRRLQTGDRIWRKDEIGRAGRIYGHAGQIHLEICLDRANLARLIGREPAWVDPAHIPAPTADGRTDAVFGDLWFYLPASTPTSTAQPANHLRAASQTTLGQAVWVRMHYQTDTGRIGGSEAGDCLLETFDESGRSLGQQAQAGFEYNLYTEATRRHNALAQNERTNSSPSGWYELLRFGRNLGRGPNAADKDPLPANAAHWRPLLLNGQNLWADLNAEGSHKFSDADFLPIQGWCFIDDDTHPDDQRCDSPNLKNLIADPNPNAERRLETATLESRLGDQEVMRILRRVICRFPSEWDQTTIATRYGFVRELEAFQEASEAWDTFEAHLRSISFTGLPAEYLNADWRLHPREFVGWMRKCGWLSSKELAQCVPRNAVEQTRSRQGNTMYPKSVITWRVAYSRAGNLSNVLNKTFRKYGISLSMLRVAYFLANSIQETIYFSRTSELGGPNTRYAPWYGRGFLQLTWEENYRRYGNFRGWQGQTTVSYRDALETDIFCAADSAGYYWITCAKPDDSILNISREADSYPVLEHENLGNVCSDYSYQTRSCSGLLGIINYYASPQAERVARAINTGNPNSTGVVNGLIPRNNVFANLLNVLLELGLLDVEKQRE